MKFRKLFSISMLAILVFTLVCTSNISAAEITPYELRVTNPRGRSIGYQGAIAYTYMLNGESKAESKSISGKTPDTVQLSIDEEASDWSVSIVLQDSEGAGGIKGEIVNKETGEVVASKETTTDFGVVSFTAKLEMPSRGGIPGFPWEAIIVGLAVGMIALLAKRGVLRLPALRPT